MRISDWSSDVCSSDLIAASAVGNAGCNVAQPAMNSVVASASTTIIGLVLAHWTKVLTAKSVMVGRSWRRLGSDRRGRSEERRGGKEGVSTCRYRWSLYH